MEPAGRLPSDDFGPFEMCGCATELNAHITPGGHNAASSGGAYHSQPEEVDSVQIDWTLPVLKSFRVRVYAASRSNWSGS